jgi:MoxR-like ATPase
VLDRNFTVFATQNPADSEGTYPLPEAQKDRFMIRIKMSPPNRDDELALARRMLGDNTPEQALAAGTVQPVIGPGELEALRKIVGRVTFREEITAYVVDLVRASREHESILVGAGPRATQCLLLGARAKAALAGREYVTPDDVRGLVYGVLGHRLVLRPEFEIEGLTTEEILLRILENVAVPR